MRPKIWLITPPFTQINTPYPATAYLKGFLNTLNIESFQSDLSLELFVEVFSSKGLSRIFERVADIDPELGANAFRIWSLHEKYISVVDLVMDFLQTQKTTLAYLINKDGFLPQAQRFDQTRQLSSSVGSLGVIDQAKFRATLFLEDLTDFIREAVDPYFGFSRYAEKIATSLSDFSVMERELKVESSIIMQFLQEIVEQKLKELRPEVVALTIPFPGNLFAALKIAETIKDIDEGIYILAGGGYCNTELRSLFDDRIFQYFDFITLDDGERPIQLILELFDQKRDISQLKRTFYLKNSVVQFGNGATEDDFPQKETGTPDYADLYLSKYISILEILNPMHRLWSDGRWNKLTMAHGCYWGKCTFCDISLDYIQRYEPLTAALLCDRVERMIEQTGERGFHFVDEAAPPSLMKAFALELLKRDLRISWWTNIRFEKSFTRDLCRLLAASGCIAVSGGLEVASDRLLELIEKGVTVEQVTNVAYAFSSSGISVHAYLMYGFPTQTVQETVDALEVVRQLFQHQVIQSGFWHQFTMTTHSPVGKSPEHFQVKVDGPEFHGFAYNDLEHTDPKGAEHWKFSEGLRVSIYNYMNGMGIGEKLSCWFDFNVPQTSIPKNLISEYLSKQKKARPNKQSIVLWIGGEPVSKSRKGNKILLVLTGNQVNQIV
ncbi:MAG: radical SAM protein, partial [Saprospiraceae bacterium]|nr:radical SAM protein [Saprospiraceae bacterium]